MLLFLLVAILSLWLSFLFVPRGQKFLSNCQVVTSTQLLPYDDYDDDADGDGCGDDDDEGDDYGGSDDDGKRSLQTVKWSLPSSCYIIAKHPLVISFKIFW